MWDISKIRVIFFIVIWIGIRDKKLILLLFCQYLVEINNSKCGNFTLNLNFLLVFSDKPYFCSYLHFRPIHIGIMHSQKSDNFNFFEWFSLSFWHNSSSCNFFPLNFFKKNFVTIFFINFYKLLHRYRTNIHSDNHHCNNM